MAYETLAKMYDALMDDVNYQEWADYIDTMLQKNGCPGKRLLDLGCGTGNISIPLAQKGYQVTGVDLSAEMLDIARSKSEAAGLVIDWQQQDLTELQLLDDAGAEPVFDAIIATFDVFNHLTSPEDLQMLFHSLNPFLVDEGILLFDVQTPYKLQEYLGNHIFTLHRDDIEYIWENHFDEESQICTMDITFFVRQENGLYQRETMCQEERVYDLELLQMWLKYSDFELIGVYGELSDEKLQPEAHRAVFVAKPMLYDGADDWFDEELADLPDFADENDYFFDDDF
ncbi:MAG: methyltransferase domain-containing protein [Peptococcaceae bacterium]|nr:methyltransferase domain-containing protein [Peptococcaceae bacterium]